jgi:hypothetical protein
MAEGPCGHDAALLDPSATVAVDATGLMIYDLHRMSSAKASLGRVTERGLSGGHHTLLDIRPFIEGKRDLTIRPSGGGWKGAAHEDRRTVSLRLHLL